ncbi:MAG: hypothetical protein O3C49_03795 [Proteobacteria bacterium]|nr:hypothetical protein [Pseudomonadota bacterium]
MKHDALPKQTDHTWIVTSGARFLSPSLRQPLASVRPVPRPVTPRPRQRHYIPTRQSLMPLSRRPVFVDR